MSHLTRCCRLLTHWPTCRTPGQARPGHTQQ